MYNTLTYTVDFQLTGKKIRKNFFVMSIIKSIF